MTHRDDDLDARLERALELGRELGDDLLSDDERCSAAMEFLQLVLGALEELGEGGSGGPSIRAARRRQAAALSQRLEEILRDQARRQLRVRWVGTELAHIEFGDECMAWLMHASSGWRLTSPFSGLASPPERVAPPGLDEEASDRASSRALDIVAEFLGHVWLSAVLRTA